MNTSPFDPAAELAAATAPATPRAARLIGVLLLAAAALAAFHAGRYYDHVVDDTYISLRYARNLVEGHGLVFNPGERVEGYTNFLFVLLAAFFLRLGLDPIASLKAVLVCAGAAALWLVARIERRWGEERRGAPLSVVFLLPLAAWVYWTFCAMETMLFTALLLAAVTAQANEARSGRFRGAVLLFVLLSLTRPEGLLIFGLSTVAVYGAAAVANPRRLGAAMRDTVVFALLFGPYFVWRLTYYGSLLPNTFYAKVTAQGQLASGLEYLGEFACAFPLFLLSLAAAPLLLRRLRGDQARRAAALWIVALGYTAYVVAIGGDFMPFFRFFVPAMPLYALFLAWLWRAAEARLAKRTRPVPLLLAALWVTHVTASQLTEQPYRAFVAHRTAVVGKRAGKWFASRLDPGDLVALNTAGSLPYYSRRPALDMLGLTDAQIARHPRYIISPGWAGHRRGWGDYVLARRPRIILWYNASGSAEPFYLGDHELADNPYFRFFYHLREVRLPPPAGSEGRVLARFLGFPFGYDPSGKAVMPELGLRLVFTAGPPPLTRLEEGPVLVRYFELDQLDVELWSLGFPRRVPIGKFLHAAVARWREERAGAPAPDASAQAQVEALCAQARVKIEAGDRAAARRILTIAAAENSRARSPLVYQYIANLAVMSGEIWTAINAQREALRLEPDNALFRRNLESLLTVPYRQAVQQHDR